MLKADVNILVMVFVAVTLPFKVSSSKHSFCLTSGDVTSLSFAPLLPLCAMNSGSGKKNKQTETNLICVCGFLPNVNNFKTDKSRSHCKNNVTITTLIYFTYKWEFERCLYWMDVHTHTLATHAERLTIMFWNGKNSLKGLNFNTKWRKTPKGIHCSIVWRRRWKRKVC